MLLINRSELGLPPWRALCTAFLGIVLALPLQGISFAEPEGVKSPATSLHAAALLAAPISGAPRASAVCMRSLVPRPMKFSITERRFCRINTVEMFDPMHVLQHFHCTPP